MCFCAIAPLIFDCQKTDTIPRPPFLGEKASGKFEGVCSGYSHPRLDFNYYFQFGALGLLELEGTFLNRDLMEDISFICFVVCVFVFP